MCLCLTLGGCASSNDGEKKTSESVEKGSYEEDFTWSDNIITGLSESGKKKKELIIPARCNGFSDLLLNEDNVVEVVSFESDRDIDLGCTFSYALNLKKISLPAELTVIDTMDFQDCNMLESINIPANVEVIGEYAFDDCDNLTEVVFEGNKVTQINYHAFENCPLLEEVVLPDSLVKIDEYAFAGCSSLTSIYLPESIRNIKAYAFNNSGLCDVYFDNSEVIDEINSTAFVQYESKVTIHVISGSWMEQNFGVFFDETYEKEYWEK